MEAGVYTAYNGRDKRTTAGREKSGEEDVDSRIHVEGWRKMEAAAQSWRGQTDCVAYAPPKFYFS